MKMTGVYAQHIKRGLTRRGWATLLAAAPFVAQAASSPQKPESVTAPTIPEQKMAKAVEDIRKISGRLAQTEVPMSIEPAFSFRAL